MIIPRLGESERDRLSDANQACKRSTRDANGIPQPDRNGEHGWTYHRRAEVVVDGETVHEDSSQAAPFELWDAVTITSHHRADALQEMQDIAHETGMYDIEDGHQ